MSETREDIERRLRSKLPDPTYDKAEIAANPEWQLAWSLSEIQNDNAPLGQGDHRNRIGLSDL